MSKFGWSCIQPLINPNKSTPHKTKTKEKRELVRQHVRPTPEIPAPKPGKSIKQLEKERKQAKTIHEDIPACKFLRNTLKGHGDVVTSVELSHDDRHIMTASADQVCIYVPQLSCA